MQYISIGDIKLSYKIVGSLGFNAEDKPALIFLHGGAGLVDHTLYTSFWSKFKNQVNVVFIDQRGCGRSDRGDVKNWNLKQFGKDVYLFCEKLNIKNPIVAGLSWGGYVALSYAIQYPVHPKAMILCNSEARMSAGERYKAFLRVGGVKAAAVVRQFDTNWNLEINEKYFKICLPFFARNAYKSEEILASAKNRNNALWTKFMTEEHCKFDLRDKLANIQCPVLHLAGTNDPVHPVFSAKETAQGIKKDLCELHIIQDTGDPVYRDQPEKTSAIIRSFLERIQSRDKQEDVLHLI